MLMVVRLPLQLTIDLHYTITPNKFHKEKNAHIPMADGTPTPSYCPYIYVYTITPTKFHIEKNTQDL